MKGKDSDNVKVDTDEVYSDPDEGVEIVDMEQVWQMDWMAPESLRKDKNEDRKKKHSKPESKKPQISKGKGILPTMVVPTFVQHLFLQNVKQLKSWTWMKL
jgi:hypothetical protein